MNRIVHSLSSGPGSKRPIGLALTLPVSASVCSQQYRTLAMTFAAPASSRPTSTSPRASPARDIGTTFIPQ
jgi:hypothetical protein